MKLEGNGSPASPRKIRPFQTPDTVAILGILRHSAEAADWPAESYAKLTASSGGILLICEANAQPIGFLAARQVADEAEILNIAVSPDFRREGIASTLLTAALDHFQGSKVARVFLELRASNRAARALYERHGFVAFGVRTSYYRNPPEDALCMQKNFTGTPD